MAPHRGRRDLRVLLLFGTTVTSVRGAAVDRYSQMRADWLDRVGALQSRLDRAFDAVPDRLVLWVLFATMAAARFPRIFHNPTFYAEEGNVYFAYAANHGVVDSLFELHVGYYSLFANVAGVISAAVPLEYAVTATRLIGFGGPVACAWVIIGIETSRLVRAASLAVVVFTYTMSAEWATAIHAQFWFAVVVLLMYASPVRSRSDQILRVGFVVVAGLTGALAGVIAPLFLLRALRTRCRTDAAIGVILAATLGVQVLFSKSREVTWHAGEFVVVAVMKLAVHPFTGDRFDRIGPDWYELWTRIPVAAAFFLVGVFWVILVVSVTRDQWRIVALAGLGVAVVGLLFAIPPYQELSFSQTGTRYVVAGVVPVLVAMVMSWDGLDRPGRIAVVILAGLAVVRGVDSGSDYAVIMNERVPIWQGSVERYAADPGVSIAMDSRCRISVNAEEQRAGFSIRQVDPTSPDVVSFVMTPGQYDDDRDVEVIVFANESLEKLTPQGWTRIGGFLYGDDLRRCQEGFGSGEPFLIATGEVRFDIAHDDLDAIAARSRNLSIGYGRDLADALAKDTLATFPTCKLRPSACE